MSETAEKLR